MTKIKDHALIERLNSLLEAKGISKAEMARIANVSPQAVNNWFTKGLIGREAATKIANTLQLSLDWILNGGPEESLNLPSVRQKRLQEWFSDKPLPENERSYISQLIKGKSSFGEKAARRIEGDYGMPSYYLDSLPDGSIAGAILALSPIERELLEYFQKFPDSEKRQTVNLFKAKADEYDKLFEELARSRKKFM